MISADHFLRRCLLAPLLLPLMTWLAAAVWWGFVGGGTSWNTILEHHPVGGLLIGLGMTFVCGGVPYLWVLSVRRQEIRHRTGARLVTEVQMLPFRMIPYYVVYSVAIAVAMALWTGFPVWLLICVAGIPAIIVVGYLYIYVTFLVLWLLQWAGWIQPTRYSYDFC